MKLRTEKYKAITTAALSWLCLAGYAQGQSSDALLDKLVQKGVLSAQEAKDVLRDSATNQPSATKWKINNAIKSIELFGDARLRYEYRSAENISPSLSGVEGNAFQRERFRYALRFGLRGDLYDNWYYGFRLETSSNPRSTWATFGSDNPTTPGAKTGINVGQIYMGWRPTSWFDITAGKMPNPLYTTPMVWDSDVAPEGAAEKFKVSLGDHVDLFSTFGQFIYQDTDKDLAIPSSDTFLLAWQLGANVKLTKDISLKFAPTLYSYTGQGSVGGPLNAAFTGEGTGVGAANGPGLNSANGVSSGYFNQSGISNLLVLEIPAELNFKVGSYNARIFGDFAYNFYGDERAREAFAVNNSIGGVANAFPTLHKANTGENKAYQVGAGFGNLGLVYGQTAKKNTWEARAYWQHVEQYALDPNLMDSDYFEGRANLQGVFTAFAYSFTDSIIGTVRYGYANRINDHLGTGGNNPDLPELNPIRNYHILQFDLTYRF